MRYLFAVLFVALVGCSEGAYCEASQPTCPGGDTVPVCVSPSVDDPWSCLESDENGFSLCELDEFELATCDGDAVVCADDGWVQVCR